jgi:magnesium transporter
VRLRPDGGTILSVIVDCAVYRDGRRTEGPDDLSDALAQCRAEHDAFVWIGLYEPTEKEFDRVTEEFALHPLAIEDALKAHQRPKLEVYDDSLFMVLKPVAYDAERDTVSSGEVMVFIGDSFVVTVRHGEESPLAAVRHRLEEEPEMLRHGPTAVLYSIADAVVDHYVDVAGELGTDLEELEAEVFSPSSGGSRSTASRIYNFKRQILEFRRATGPLAQPLVRLASIGPFLASLPFVHDKAQPFFRDVSDHLTRISRR